MFDSAGTKPSVLVAAAPRVYHSDMSATELLRQFKALPAFERKKFLRAALASGKPVPGSKRPARRVEWPDVEARARRITGDHLVPNLVLAERDTPPK
jgi:hypothetical protein